MGTPRLASPRPRWNGPTPHWREEEIGTCSVACRYGGGVTFMPPQPPHVALQPDLASCCSCVRNICRHTSDNAAEFFPGPPPPRKLQHPQIPSHPTHNPLNPVQIASTPPSCITSRTLTDENSSQTLPPPQLQQLILSVGGP